MSNPFKTITIGLCPNFQLDDVLLSLSLFIRPWTYFDHSPQIKLTGTIKNYFAKKHVFLFDSGRTSLYFLLKAMKLNNGDEIIIQAFTCSVVPGSIIQANLTPIYVDIDETLNLDPAIISAAITSKTKAIIVQHTFGTPANIFAIQKICSENNLILIEDCAHGLGGNYHGKKLGTFGKAAFLSFGRDKVISGVWGGAIITDDDNLAQSLEKITNQLPERSPFWTIKTLLYSPLIFLIIQTYSFFSFGKILHLLLRHLHVLSDAITPAEKSALSPKSYYKNLPPLLCSNVLEQWNKLDSFIKHRQTLAKYYSEQLGMEFNPNSTYLRYNLFIDNPDELRRIGAKQNIFLGDWYNSPVAPKSVNPTSFSYIIGSCPKAEKISQQIINLPTNPNINIKDARKVLRIVGAIHESPVKSYGN